MPSEPVTLAQRYVLESLIAQGGMAAVWSARDDVLARTVAVKILHPHLAGDASFLERFRREALAAARLSHPNIVAIYDTGVEQTDEGERHYIVMEHCGGGTLADVMGAEGALLAPRAVSIGSVVCDALAYAHGNGIVHRDVKPANVLITQDGTIKVADFGIAKAAEIAGDVTTTGAILGTVSYLSPEQARGDEPDGRSDIYSLGVLLYEMLTGRPPFAGETHIATAMMHLREPPPPPRSIRAGIPRAVETALLKALEKDPDSRFQSAAELKSALLASSSGSATTAEIERPRVRHVRREQHDPGHRRGALRWIVPVVVLIAAAVAAAILIPSLLGDETPASGDRQSQPPTSAIAIKAARDFDPHGTGGTSEHPTEVFLAHDGDTATYWTTEGYDVPLSKLKPGVGVVFDLGAPEHVTRVRITMAGADHSFQLMAGSEPGSDETSFEEIETVEHAEDVVRLTVDETAQYWLVWITDLPGGQAGAGGIGEVEFFGP